MILVEETQVPEAALPLDALKRHLRLGTGFAEDDVQDPVLASFLRAAMAAIEARTSKALITRGFLLTLDRWRHASEQTFPVSPVQSISEVTVIDGFGGAQTVEPERYRLIKDAFKPKLSAAGGTLPQIAEGGSAEIRFEAGHADAFDALPADIAQAVLLLAAHYYEFRDDTSLGQGCMPFGVTSLIARYRPVRVGLGR